METDIVERVSVKRKNENEGWDVLIGCLHTYILPI